MNERIKELIEQATESKGFLTAGDSVKPLPVREFNKEKFAELIVRECISVLQNVPNGYSDYRNQIEDADRRYCISHIKEHFGVE